MYRTKKENGIFGKPPRAVTPNDRKRGLTIGGRRALLTFARPLRSGLRAGRPDGIGWSLPSLCRRLHLHLHLGGITTLLLLRGGARLLPSTPPPSRRLRLVVRKRPVCHAPSAHATVPSGGLALGGAPRANLRDELRSEGAFEIDGELRSEIHASGRARAQYCNARHASRAHNGMVKG